MSAEDVRSFCTAHLILTPSLDFLTGEGDAVTTILKMKVQKPDPNQLMNRLGFDEQARTRAGAMFEVLRDSDALNKYSSYFEDYRPSYEGDTSFEGGPGDIEHGGSYGSGIETSGFVSPGTKNNLDLVVYAVQAWENNWGYVWGTYGNVLTESLFAYKLKQYPNGVGKYKNFIRANWLGRRTADCIGLIKGYGWLDASSGAIRYGTNGMPDYGANQMYQSAAVKGSMETMPEIKGLAVWKPGHIGVYIGGGYVVEALGTKYGAVKAAGGGGAYRDSIQAWLPIKNIRGGVVVTRDNRFIKILEVLPVNIYLKSANDCQNIIASYAAWLKIAPDNIQLEARTLPADTARRYLDVCELKVLEPRYTDDFILKLLYEIINKRTSRRVKLPEGVFDMTTAVHGIYEE